MDYIERQLEMWQSVLADLFSVCLLYAHYVRCRGFCVCMRAFFSLFIFYNCLKSDCTAMGFFRQN